MTAVENFKNTSIASLRDALTRMQTEGAAIGHFNSSSGKETHLSQKQLRNLAKAARLRKPLKLL